MLRKFGAVQYINQTLENNSKKICQRFALTNFICCHKAEKVRIKYCKTKHAKIEAWPLL